MRPVPAIDVKARVKRSSPGGLRVMLIDLKAR